MAPSRLTVAAAGLLASSITFPWAAAEAATLPIPCVAGVCGANNPFVVGAGRASASQAGATLTVNQTTQNVTLNWQSFNISADGTVNFVQPNSSAVALNRIFDANPTQIFGSLNANGRVYLLNGNGIIFGKGAQVNVGSLVASTLNTSIDSGTNNYSLLAPGANGNSAFQQFTDPNTGQPLNHSVLIQQGATLQSAEGGQILVFAPTIVNEGKINTPGGQTVLAAGTQVYLASTDSTIRGLLVEVAADNGTKTSVTNGNQAANANTTDPAQLVGQIVAERGNVTLAGLAVNQFGRISATTSVNENGSIRLQAGTGTVLENGGAVSGRIQAGTGGTLTLGPHSDTEVTLDTADTSTTVDSIPQPKSDVTLLGATVNILTNSTVRATGGTIEAEAAQNQAALYQTDASGNLTEGSGLTAAQDGSRVYVAPGATLDVSGASVTLPVSSNIISAQLRGTELADDPLQQNGPLHGETVYFDIRAHGTNADGTTWQGTPLANVSGEIAAIQRNVAERNLTGGTITLRSQGDVIVAQSADLNISGGVINYTGGMIDTTNLLTTTGKAVPIGSADPNALYVGTLNGATVSNPKWGTTRNYGNVTGQYEQGYTQGFDAGTLNLTAPKFVFDGTVSGTTTAGVYQRLKDSASVSVNNPYFVGYDGLDNLYRNYDQVPLAATLNIGEIGVAHTTGTEFVVGNVVLQSGAVLAGLRNADGSAFDPLTDPLPANYTASVLHPELMGGSNGFGNISVKADGEFLQPGSVALRLPAGGSYGIQASVVDIEGSVDAPGGTIGAAALVTTSSSTLGTSLTLGPQGALTARGEWVNDSPSLYGGGINTAPLYIGGGTVSLSSQAYAGSSSVLILAPGSLIDVSGGAQLTSTGQLVYGTGGAISLQALPQAGVADVTQTPPQPAQIELGATLRGYGLTQGGKLAISAGAVCIAASDCSKSDLNTLWLTPGFFSTGGFSAYSITADQGALTLAPNTTVLLQQQNVQLVNNYARLGNSESLPILSKTVLLPDAVRGSVNLSLAQYAPDNARLSVSGETLNALDITPDTPSLEIGTGSIVAADPGASLSLTSNARIVVDGTLSSPGGSIAMSITAPTQADPLVGVPASQGIWLGSTGVLDVHGVPLIQVAANGVRTGNVLSGGTVSLDAEYGYVELLPGSLINVSGGSGTVDVVQFARPPRSQLVGSAGGSVILSAGEGMILGGSFEAAGGPQGSVGAQPAGGSLTVEMTNKESLPSDVSSGGYEIQVSQTLAPLVIAPGAEVPDVLAGTAYVPVDSIAAAGFGSLTLRAQHYSYPPLVGLPLPGEIAFNGSVNLNFAQQITLDAGVYAVSPGATAQIHAPYVEFGNSDQQNGYVAGGMIYDLPPLQPGTGMLDVSGDFVELYGWMALQGIGRAQFDSTGDLRLTGLQNLRVTEVAPLGGGLFTSGDLELSASQIYPSTLSTFEIAAGVSTAFDSTGPTSAVPTSGTIWINPAKKANTNTDLLSAGGSLTLLAHEIDQQGVLRAPFGTLDLKADTVNLLLGSVTSTSSDGLTVPFGTTQGGFDWVYTLLNSISIVYGTDGVPLPSQHVILDGTNVVINKGAVVDVSGGGDLLAYEWIPGVGGTKDVLSQSVRPNQYAIVPGLKANVAPYDPSISPGDGLQLGQTVYLSASPGLPAGYYTLLPARYAFLPGAFLVSATSGYQDLPAGQTLSAPGGGTIVSGYMTIAGTPFGASRMSGFTVVPASVVLGQAQTTNGVTSYTGGQAQYNATGANAFFANQAAAANTVPGRLPEDSGILDLVASTKLTLDGSLNADTKDGLGAAVDIASSQIVVGSDTSTPVQPGQLLVTTEGLNQLGAQTLLIGGQLSSTGAISVKSSQVTVASGAKLTGPEVLLAATDQVTVSSGASITASGTAATTRDYTLTGDSAFLSVAAGPQATVTHTGAVGNSGILTLASGSSLTANQGSIFLDASQNVVTQGSINAAGGDLALQSTRIAVGTPPSGSGSSPGTVLDPTLFTVAGLRNVLLSSETSIDFYGSTGFNAKNLTLDTQSLSGYGASRDVASLTASGNLTLTNTQKTGTAIAGTGSGSLELNAANINIGPGALSSTGFATLALNAQQAITGTGAQSNSSSASKNQSTSATQSASLTTNGNLAITAAEITTGTDVSLALTANNGAVTMLAPTQPANLAPVTALGGSLSITGSSVELGTQIVMPSGKVSLVSTGGGSAPGSDVVLDSGGSISVAGLIRTYNGTDVPTPGGTVTLTSAGNVNLASGSTIDVSGAKGGAGGSLSITASAGNVTAGGSLLGGGTGASFNIDAQSFDFASLTSTLGAGFSGSQNYRLRGDPTTCQQNCDLTVAAGTSVKANSISLEADNGSVAIEGKLDASGASGGSVVVAASNNLTVDGTIAANATAAGGKGGRVQLELGNNSTGSLQLNSGSVINVSGGGPDSKGDGGTGGSVLLRVPGSLALNQATNGGTGIVLAGSIQGSTSNILEVVKVYSNGPGGLIDSNGILSPDDTTTGINAINTDITGFMQSLASYGQSLGSAFALEAGVEIDGVKTADDPTGSLQLNTPWNLYTWRFGNGTIPGVLTMRAAGDLIINSPLSDGFVNQSTFTLPTTPTNSWSYRLVAGADLTAANPLTTSNDPTASFNIARCLANCTLPTGTGGRGGGSTTYTPNFVRTGNGFIDVSSSGDFVLGTPDPDNPGSWLSGSQAALLYTAGVANPNGLAITARNGGSLQGLAYPIDGGDINISVGGDVAAQAPTQFVNAWLWRVGPTTSGTTAHPTSAWTVSFQSFQQGIGALGGGDVTVHAGGDVDNLSVSIPSVGAPVGSTLPASTLQITGGGNLTVTAGGSILGGSYYTGAGTLSLNAGGDVGQGLAMVAGTPYELAPLLGLGNASAFVTARGNLQLAGILDPFLLDSGAPQSAVFIPVWFSTYGANSSANLVAVGGDLTLDDESAALLNTVGASFSGGKAIFGGTGDQATSLFNVLPPTLNAYALGGNINISNNLTLTASPTGNLDLFADQNIAVAAVTSQSFFTSITLDVSDTDPALLPTPATPAQNFAPLAAIYAPTQHAVTPVHAGDTKPVMLVARTGNVDFTSPTTDVNQLISAKPVQVWAGHDVVDLNLAAQNNAPSDVTSITAGNDIIYPQLRTSQGGLAADTNAIVLAGPGQLELTAGNTVNFGTSLGVTTRGNLDNPALPKGGADVSITAGVSSSNPEQVAAFINQYIDGTSQFDQELVSFVETTTGQNGVNASQAHQAFDGMSNGLKTAFVEQVFFDLLRTNGRIAAAAGPKHNDFSGAYAALQALFPGSNPDLPAGQKDPYSGDILLYFSQVYTDQGGNVSLLAPGGQINAGLAQAPSAFGVSKQPNQLGIVVQTTGSINAFSYGDFQVNQSRVFAADGGNILVWSTEGNIDAGRGSKTSLSAAPASVSIDPNSGVPIITLTAPVAGSGIQALAVTPGSTAGDVDLFAPHGVVNANDAGIVAGNLTVAATAVLGTNNITVTGTSVGVPVAVTGLGANAVGASSSAASNVNSAANSFENREETSKTPAADTALGWLDVFVLGFGEEACKADDAECLKRQTAK